jgi:hypothetical protein
MYSLHDQEEKLVALGKLFECFGHSKITDVMVSVYKEGSDKHSLEAVQKAAHEFMTGQDDRSNQGNIPTPAQFLKRVAEIDRSIRAIAAMKEKQLPPPRVEPKTPEQIEMVKRIHENYKRWAAVRVSGFRQSEMSEREAENHRRCQEVLGK